MTHMSAAKTWADVLDDFVTACEMKFAVTNPARLEALVAHVATVKMTFEALENEVPFNASAAAQ